MADISVHARRCCQISGPQIPVLCLLVTFSGVYTIECTPWRLEFFLSPARARAQCQALLATLLPLPFSSHSREQCRPLST
ncbi:hypothetical protein BD414DRAFT_13812 [Trametes punicea]|nr:hypothetical protein BD414DRAFT_13812 [Trametes punicea]